MKRKIAITMAIIMSLSTVIPTLGAVTFDDINDVPWQGAEVFINRAGELELMVGEVVGNKRYFRAKDNITCFETLQIIYSVLQKTNNLKDTKNIESKWSYVMEQLSVPKWAYPATSYALEYGIVSMTEVGKFTNQSNGSQNLASREAVAVMLGKAMSDKYPLDPNAKLIFDDAASVNPTSIQYVDLLYRLEIVLGDNNNFKPKSPINRAEMATMVTKAYDKMNTGNTTNPSNPGGNVPSQNNFISSGTVATVSDMGSSYLVTIIKSDGSKIGLFAGETTTVKNLAGGNSDYTALSTGDTIKDVVYNGSDIKSLTITYDADPGLNQSVSGTVEGTIDEIYNDIVYINKKTGGTAKYYLNINCEYILDGKKVSQKDLFDAYDKGRLDVSATLNTKAEVTKLDCKTRDGEYMYGEVRDISESRIRIKKDGRTSTIDYDWTNDDVDDVDFYLNDKSSTYSKVKDAFDDYDTLYVKYLTDSKDDIKKLYASKYSFDDDENDDEIKGTINNITKRYVTVKKSGSSSYKDYDFEDSDVENATLKIDNKTYDYYDFRDKLDREGTMSVTIELNKDGEVERVLATTDDSSSGDRSGVIKKLSSSEIAVGSSSNVFDLANSVTVTSNRNEIDDLDSLRKYFDDSGVTIEADLTINSGKVTKINAYVKEVEGRLLYFDKRKATLEVRTKDDKRMVFDFRTSSLNVKGDVKDIDRLDTYVNDKGYRYDIVIDVSKSNGYAETITLTEI